MSAQEDAAYQKYLEDLKSAVPAELHAHLDALAANEKFKDVGFKGQIRQDEFHRRLNELEEQKKKFNSDKAATEEFYAKEFAKNQKLLAERGQLENQLNAAVGALKALGMDDQIPTNSAPAATPSKEIEELRNQLKQANEALQGMNQSLPHFLKDTLNITTKILKGNYELDPAAVLDYSMQNRVTPDVAFQTLTADENKRRADAELQKKIDEAKEAGRKEALSKLPTPDFTGRRHVPGGSLAHLMSKEGQVDSRQRVQGAANTLREMLAKGEISQADLANP